MNQLLSHPDYEELLGAYALDAVDAPEAAAVELHLVACPRCRTEVSRHRETAALLGHAGATAPEGLWDRISGQLREAPPALALVRAPGSLSGAPRALGAAPHVRGSDRNGAGSAAARWRRRVSVRPVVALAGVAAVVIGMLGFEISNLQGQVTQVRRSVNSGGLQQLADVALGTPGHETVTLSSATSKEWATAVIAPNGQGYLIDARLSPLASDRTYQLWGLAGGIPISLGLLGDAPSEASFHLEFSHVTRLMITVEPVGGVQQPDEPAVVMGTAVAN